MFRPLIVARVALFAVCCLVTVVASQADDPPLPDCQGSEPYTPPDHACQKSSGTICEGVGPPPPANQPWIPDGCTGSRITAIPNNSFNFSCKDQVIGSSGGKKTSTCGPNMIPQELPGPTLPGQGPIIVLLPEQRVCNGESKCYRNAKGSCVSATLVFNKSAITVSIPCKEVVIPGSGGPPGPGGGP